MKKRGEYGRHAPEGKRKLCLGPVDLDGLYLAAFDEDSDHHGVTTDWAVFNSFVRAGGLVDDHREASTATGTGKSGFGFEHGLGRIRLHQGLRRDFGELSRVAQSSRHAGQSGTDLMDAQKHTLSMLRVPT